MARDNRIDLSDLLNAGLLTPGMTLYPRPKKHAERVGTLLADGRIDIDGTLLATPAEATLFVRGRRGAGWGVFLVERNPRRTLRDVRREYIESRAGDGDEDDDDPDDDEG